MWRYTENHRTLFAGAAIVHQGGPKTKSAGKLIRKEYLPFSPKDNKKPYGAIVFTKVLIQSEVSFSNVLDVQTLYDHKMVNVDGVTRGQRRHIT